MKELTAAQIERMIQANADASLGEIISKPWIARINAVLSERAVPSVVKRDDALERLTVLKIRRMPGGGSFA